jgi:hypothetical protein
LRSQPAGQSTPSNDGPCIRVSECVEIEQRDIVQSSTVLAINVHNANANGFDGIDYLPAERERYQIVYDSSNAYQKYKCRHVVSEAMYEGAGGRQKQGREDGQSEIDE